MSINLDIKYDINFITNPRMKNRRNIKSTLGQYSAPSLNGKNAVVKARIRHIAE